ncbi:MAG: insulinase family protein [bacterium]|jgi:zinc protease
MIKKILLFIGITSVAAYATAQEKLPDNFFMKKLNNGLEVLVIEDANVPLATIEIVVRNGSYTEDKDYNGLSHLYEHMFFKANKDYPSQKAFLDKVSELGVSFNGTTSEERVNYFITLSKEKLTPGLEFMNSAIRYPLFDTTEMRKENPVVAGEFQRAESNPFFALFDKMNKEVWGDNYTRKNPIGDYEIIYTATSQKMNVIKDKYYYPNNSLLAICGDVDHNKVFAEAERVFGTWSPTNVDPFQKWPIPEFKPIEYSKNFIVESPNAQVPMFMTTFHGPDTRNDLKATYAADVFSYILQQKNSKLYKELVETGLAFQVNVGYQTAKYVGPIRIILVPNPRKLEEAYNILWKNINEWDSDEYFTDEQLQTAKDLLSVSEMYNMEKPSNFIHTVTYWWSSANISYYTNYTDNLQKVTRDDIKNYVRKYIKGNPYVMGAMMKNGMRKNFNTDKFFAPSLSMEEYTLSFDMNQTELTSEKNNEKLVSLVQWLKINPVANISIEAYTHEGENKNTGNTRYETILNYLKTNGIEETRIIGTSNKAFQIKKIKSANAEEQANSRKITFAIVKK